jgi:nucleotide-binding universal stress UspA family protein
MKDVLALLSPVADKTISAAASYATGLARAHEAALSILIAEIEPHSAETAGEPDNMQADRRAAAPPSLDEKLARTAENVAAAAQAAGVACAVLAPGDDNLSLRERVTACAQVRDMLVVDVTGPLRPPRKDLVEGALFGSGRPIILVPPNGRTYAPNRIVIAWDATRSAVRAVHDALPLLLRTRHVTIVSVVDDKALLPLHAGDMLRRYLALWKIDARFDAIVRGAHNVGATLLAHARRTQADLLVMGGFAHSFERQLMLGSATQDVFRANAEIPVLMSH